MPTPSPAPPRSDILYNDTDLFLSLKHKTDLNQPERIVKLYNVIITDEKGNQVNVFDFDKYNCSFIYGDIRWESVSEKIVKKKYAEFDAVLVQMGTITKQWVLSWTNMCFDVPVWFDSSTCWFSVETVAPSYTMYEEFIKITRMVGAFLVMNENFSTFSLKDLLYEVARFTEYSLEHVVHSFIKRSQFVINQLEQLDLEHHDLVLKLKQGSLRDVLRDSYTQLPFIGPDTELVKDVLFPVGDGYYICPFYDCRALISAMTPSLRQQALDHFNLHVEALRILHKEFLKSDPGFERQLHKLTDKIYDTIKKAIPNIPTQPYRPVDSLSFPSTSLSSSSSSSSSSGPSLSTSVITSNSTSDSTFSEYSITSPPKFHLPTSTSSTHPPYPRLVYPVKDYIRPPPDRDLFFQTIQSVVRLMDMYKSNEEIKDGFSEDELLREDESEEEDDDPDNKEEEEEIGRMNSTHHLNGPLRKGHRNEKRKRKDHEDEGSDYLSFHYQKTIGELICIDDDEEEDPLLQTSLNGLSIDPHRIHPDRNQAVTPRQTECISLLSDSD